MAKIIVSYYRSDEISAGTTLCFYDSLFQELKRFGNDVLAINMAYYGIFNPNTTNNFAFETYLLQEAVRFDPDIIIAFNHHILRSILQEIDVPVVIYDGDELRYFADLDIIKRDISRYKIFSIVKDWRQSYLDFGFRDDQIFYIPPGTAITNDRTVQKDKNISFLGQRRYFLSDRFFEYIRQGEDVGSMYELYQDFLRTRNYNYMELFQKEARQRCGIDFEDSDLWPLFDQSYLIFANLLDLGLHLGGHESAWCDIAQFAPQIAAAHDRSRVFSLAENQRYYNSSVLSLCPMHPQARGKGFSWRCYDIMGSSACLVASTTSELREQTKGWVDLPMFDTPAEARKICERLLTDSSERENLILQSNEFIQCNGRWVQRFAQMEQILGVKLIHEGKEGSFRKLTEHPVWMEEPVGAATELAAVSADTAGAPPAEPVQREVPVHIDKAKLHRWKLKILLEKLYQKSIHPILLLFLCVGELSMLAVCALAQADMFVLCIGSVLSMVLAWISGMGALCFFAALCICFLMKFGYKAILWVGRRIRR